MLKGKKKSGKNKPTPTPKKEQQAKVKVEPTPLKQSEHDKSKDREETPKGGIVSKTVLQGVSDTPEAVVPLPPTSIKDEHPNKISNQPQPAPSRKPTIDDGHTNGITIEESESVTFKGCTAYSNDKDPLEFPFERIFTHQAGGLRSKVKRDLTDCMRLAELAPDDILAANFSGPLDDLAVTIVSNVGRKYLYAGGELTVS